MANETLIECPFCVFKTNTNYQIMLHLEIYHPEFENPCPSVDNFANLVAMLNLTDHQDHYACCPLGSCGEAVLLTELSRHVDMHKQRLTARNFGHLSRNQFESESKAPINLTNSAEFSSLEIKDKMVPESSSQGANGRMGNSELGPHACEAQMPAWLVKLLKDKDGQAKTIGKIRDGKLREVEISPNMTAGVIPVLAQLLRQDSSTQYAYICHPAVKHVSKLRKEGGLCGYRNIQMLCSYIVETGSQGHEVLDKKIPTIFQIQDYIEMAWDNGINSQGRLETGGIRGTRKYIGTPEAQAMFCCLGIPYVTYFPGIDITAHYDRCKAGDIRGKGLSKPAHEFLFQMVESYFSESCVEYDSKVRNTFLPPIYLQIPGHSMTIIGFEMKNDESMNIIVFDPAFHDSPSIIKLIDQTIKLSSSVNMLNAYRKGIGYFKKYDQFEFLKLSSAPPH